MSTFKKFSNCCAGFAIFTAVMECFCQFMTVSPDEVESMKERILLFFSPENPKDYRGHVILCLWIVLGLFLSALFRKAPYLGFLATLIPFGYGWLIFFEEKLYNRPILIPLLLTIWVTGSVYDCICADRKRPRGIGFLLGNCASLAPALFCGFILFSSSRLGETLSEKRGLIETVLFRAAQGEKDLQAYMTVAILYLGCILISCLFFQIYFVDGVLSLIPMCYVIYHWNADNLPVFGAVLAVLSVLCALVRLAVMLTCSPWERKKEKKK